MRLFLCALPLLVASMCLAQTAPASTRPAGEELPLPEVNNARLTELAAQIVLVHDVPGVAIAVVDRGGLYAMGAAGVRKAGEPERLTPEDVFHLGSCGKMMTSAALARLADAGKLSFDQPIASYLPGIALHEGFKSLTLRELLTHRSGISEATDADQLAFLRLGAKDPRASRRALLERILSAAPTGARSKFAYANANYLIAAAIAEAIANVEFEELIKQEVFRPLNMTSVGFGATGNQPRGHRSTGQGARPIEPGIYADNPAGMAPAGTIHMSLRDWARFCSLLLGGGPKDFLRPQSHQVLTSPPQDADGSEDKPRYAAGIGVSQTRGALTYSHAGSNTLWFSQAVLFPGKEGGASGGGWGILVATNIGGEPGQKAITEVIKELVALSR